MRHSQTSWWLKVAMLAAVVACAAGAAFHLAGSSLAATASNRNSEARPVSSLALPLFFEPNQGQTDPRVKFLARGSGYGLFLTRNEAVLTLQRAAANGGTPARNVIHMRLDGASSGVRVRGTGQLPGRSSYFIGNHPEKWHRNIPQFARVEYQAVYPGIDLVYYGHQGQLEYDFRVAPGAEPGQIALSFEGASARLDSGDLVLSTAGGDVRFHAPRIYQPGTSADTPIPGSFRQLADNKIGFAVASYDRSRELVIDPLLSYSTYLGGTGAQSLVQVAVDSSNNIYLAGSTTSTDFPTVPLNNSSLQGNQNIFISKINPTLTPNSAELVYSIYLGGSAYDYLAGVAVDTDYNVYVAGSTTSPNFPTTTNAFQTSATGSHGFLSKLDPTGTILEYSTYLAGNGTDSVTGLAVDVNQNAYVTGVTSSTNDQSNGFPSNPNGFQLTSNSPGNNQFFASKIGTLNFSGFQSMLYSTYFGGGNPSPALVIGGGIAVDASSNMYFTGATNMQSVTGVNNEAPYPIYNAYQPCLNEPGTSTCSGVNPSDTDAILVKINPSLVASPPVYSTYLGGSLNEIGTGVAVDTSSNAYITGSTNSTNWVCSSPCLAGPFGYLGNGNNNAFIAKVGNETQANTIFPLIYFTYLGGSGPDVGQAIMVDSVGTAHLAGTTASPNLPITADALQVYQGNGDAFAALIATSGLTTGNYVTYLGGSQQDQGTSIALDLYNNAYVAGTTLSPPSPCTPPLCTPPLAGFPITTTAYQTALNGSQPNAFVSKIGNSSTIAVSVPTTSPTPSPVAAGTPAAFTFDLTNAGTDPATNVTFYALVPTSGVSTSPTAKITSGSGACTAVQGNTIVCNIASLAVNAVGSVEVDVTPSIPVVNPNQPILVSGSASANGGPVGGSVSQQDYIVDFQISASPASLTINAGDTASFPITLTPEPQYNATITMSQTTTPSMVTATTPSFTNSTVTLSGSTPGTTTLNIQTVPRPVSTGSLSHRSSFYYATWLPIGGLSLLGLGVGAGRRRRRWLAGAALGLLAALLLLQPACNTSSSSAATTGGTAAGIYTITVTGSNGTGASHQAKLSLTVN